MFCALLGHTGERLQDHWSSGFFTLTVNKRSVREGRHEYRLIGSMRANYSPVR